MSQNAFTSMLLDRWLYRGEGNENLALSLVNKQQILRLPKTEANHSSDLEGIDDKCLNFYNLIMIPLLGRSYASPAFKISTNKEEINKLNETLLSYRPEHRKHKHLKPGWATVWNDYAFLPEELTCNPMSSVFAVEIKLKQGWCPLEERNYDKCQFCRNQYLKLQNSQIQEISSYCPMDLFSGNKIRMFKALKALIINPQNNLKVFCDGNLIYGENLSPGIFYDILCKIFQTEYKDALLENFCNLIQQALLKEHPVENCKCDEFKVQDRVETLEQAKCNFDLANLPKGCVLNRILQLQKLNLWGLKKYYEFSQILIKNDASCNLKFGYLDMVLEMVGPNCVRCSVMSLNEEPFVNEGNLVPYLIASVLNDCSLMVTFQKTDRLEGLSEEFLINVARDTFIVKVQVFDLYPKPFSVLEKHAKRNVKVQNASAVKLEK